ncbi:MAG: hypothetical protein AUJ39_01245 [Parcubacteria group bacterium CG1_02_42_13]|nr:MAG: hypothetical protein AUJ39_01245 [Parcubacteria group bacterium CG1_02_42_13]
MKPRNYVPGIAENGRRYASPLEERMAAVFEKEGIRYEYSKFFLVKNGTKQREVDFVLKTPVMPKRCNNGPVKYIEMKGRITSAARKQHDELAGIGVVTFIITGKLVRFYEKNGFLEESN